MIYSISLRQHAPQSAPGSPSKASELGFCFWKYRFVYSGIRDLYAGVIFWRNRALIISPPAGPSENWKSWIVSRAKVEIRTCEEYITKHEIRISKFKPPNKYGAKKLIDHPRNNYWKRKFEYRIIEHVYCFWEYRQLQEVSGRCHPRKTLM